MRSFTRHTQRCYTRGIADKQPFYTKLKYGPRSRGEFWGLVLGASLFPISMALMNWYDGKNRNTPELAPEFNSMTSVLLRPKQELGGPFTLLDSKTGKTVTNDDVFLGKWTLLYFGFSKCAEVCPTTLTFISEVLKACDKEYGSEPDLSAAEKELQSAFLSIDFIRDKPEVVEAFVRKYDPRIRGLCGTRLQVEAAARVWRVYYSSVDETDEEREAREERGIPPPGMDDTYQFDHSSAIYLVGPDGKMKDFFFKEMGVEDTVNRLGVHFSDVYGFSDTRK